MNLGNLARSGMIAGIGPGILAIIALAIYWEFSLWAECRNDHSWLYCMRVLG